MNNEALLSFLCIPIMASYYLTTCILLQYSILSILRGVTLQKQKRQNKEIFSRLIHLVQAPQQTQNCLQPLVRFRPHAIPVQATIDESSSSRGTTTSIPNPKKAHTQTRQYKCKNQCGKREFGSIGREK